MGCELVPRCSSSANPDLSKGIAVPGEEDFVQALVPKRFVKTLNEKVLDEHSGLDVFELDGSVSSPDRRVKAQELWAVVAEPFWVDLPAPIRRCLR